MTITHLIKFNIKGVEVELSKQDAEELLKALRDTLEVSDGGSMKRLFEKFKKDSYVPAPYPVPYPYPVYREPYYKWNEVWCSTSKNISLSTGASNISIDTITNK